MSRTVCGILVAASLWVAGGAQAQAPTPGVGIEFEPYVGVFLPLTDLVGDDVGGVQVTASQKEGFALGGRMLFKLGGAMGIEINGLYAISDVENDTGATSATEDAYAWTVDGRLHLSLLPGPISIHGTGGVAMIGHGGDGWDQVVSGELDVAGVLGAGVKFGLGPLTLRGDADVYIYSAQLTIATPGSPGSETEAASEVQTDLVISAGLVLSY